MPPLRLRLLHLLISALASALLITAHAAPLAPTTSVEGITEYRLANGLQVLLFPDASKESITVNVTYKVGSRHENYGETGMAHLLEHMLFKGSARHRDIPKELTDHGTRPNGTTWYDRTNYFETFAASEANLRWALDLEADRMVNSFVAKKDLDSEFSVVRNEFEMNENSPFTALTRRVEHAMFSWHNYGKLTIGNRADIENVPIERLQAFYRQYYQPDNAVLLVAGRFDPAKTLTLIDQLFGKIPRPKRTLPRLYTVEPTQDGEQTITVRRVADLGLVMAAWRVPAAAHPDFAGVEILATVLGDTPTGRLHKALVQSKLAVEVGAQTTFTHDPFVFELVAVLAKDAAVEPAQAALLQQIAALKSQPVTEAEVERARAKLLKAIDLELANPEQLGTSISEFIGQGDWRLYFLRRDRLRQVSAAQVKAVAERYLVDDNRTVGIFIPTDKPERADIPERPDVALALQGYQGDPVAATASEAFDPTPDNIERRLQRSTTASGLRLALLPKPTRGQTVQARLQLHWGDLNSLQARGLAVSVAADMLLRGTTQLSRQQIQDKLDQLRANVSIGGSAQGLSVGIETRRAQLPEVLQLVRSVLREPAFSADEFEQLRTAAIASAEAARREPQAIAGIALRQLTSPYPAGHPLAARSIDQTIADYRALRLDDVSAAYRNFFSAGRAELAIVGDFDAAAVQPQLATFLADWPAQRAFERIPSQPLRQVSVPTVIATPDKANAMLLANLGLAVNEAHLDHAALLVAQDILGGGAMRSRLSQRLRENDGLSYASGSSYQAGAIDPVGGLWVYAIFAPQNQAKVDAGVREVFQALATQGFSKAEVEAAKVALQQAARLSRSQDRELVDHLASGLYLQRTLAFDAALEKRIQALSVAEVNAAFRRHIDWTRFSVVKAGDFAAASGAAAAPAK